MDKRVFYLLGNLLGIIFFTFLSQAAYQAWLKSNSVLAFGIVVMNGLILILYLIRRQPDAITRHFPAWLIGVIGTLLSLLYRPGQIDVLPMLATAGNVMQVLGLATVFGSLISLNRSLGIVPANRGIKQVGLYRFIRHPLYASELLFFSGYVLSNQSLVNFIILIAQFAFQYSRARIEENFLMDDPVYLSYMMQTRYRFIPGIL